MEFTTYVHDFLAVSSILLISNIIFLFFLVILFALFFLNYIYSHHVGVPTKTQRESLESKNPTSETAQKKP